MKKLEKEIISILIVGISLITSTLNVFADTPITIDNVTFLEYSDEFGMVDDSLVTVKVAFTLSDATEQISLLLTSENISEISNETKPKIVYMVQDITPEDGIYEFAVEKSRISSACGSNDINGCTLFLKMGGKNTGDMATQILIYHNPTKNYIPGDVDDDGDVTNLDGTFLLRYLAGWDLNNINQDAMDVDGDGDITNLDGTYLLRYLAGWNIELK